MCNVDVLAGVERKGGRAAVGCLAGMLVLLWSGVCAAEILNPSFETAALVQTQAQPGSRRLLPAGWGRVDHPSFNSYCTPLWRTDGGLAAGLFSRLTNSGTAYSFKPGVYQSFCQDVDLTEVRAVTFDVRLAAYPSGEFDHFEASLLVDGEPLWTETVGGVYLDQEVNVSRFSGWRRVEMRIAALESGTFDRAYWTQWDNLRLLEGPTTIEAFIDLDPDTLNLGSNGRWITCYIKLPEGYNAATIDASNVKLGGVPAHTGPEGWATPGASEGNMMDPDEDGVPECRMVKFDRAAVQSLVQAPEATLTVTGELSDGTPFAGSATVKVVDKGGKK